MKIALWPVIIDKKKMIYMSILIRDKLFFEAKLNYIKSIGKFQLEIRALETRQQYITE